MNTVWPLIVMPRYIKLTQKLIYLKPESHLKASPDIVLHSAWQEHENSEYSTCSSHSPQSMSTQRPQRCPGLFWSSGRRWILTQRKWGWTQDLSLPREPDLKREEETGYEWAARLIQKELSIKSFGSSKICDYVPYTRKYIMVNSPDTVHSI